ncbi:MAG: WD40 repeat domain-containing protein, partial [Planctomycetaceae bacterium]|nr:WD40 repeat domain-containing protein [Planctomycetaceae bacterium]
MPVSLPVAAASRRRFPADSAARSVDKNPPRRNFQRSTPARLSHGTSRWCGSRLILLLVLCGAGIPALGHSASGQEGSLQSLAGHTDPVYAVTASADGRWLVTGSFDETLRVWDVQRQQTVRTMAGGHTGLVLSLAISPDGSQIASGGIDRLIRLWDVPVPSPLATLPAHPQGTASVALSRDGKVMISGGADGSLKVWTLEPAEAKPGEAQPDAGDPVEKSVLKGNGRPITRVAIRPDGKSAAVADATGDIQIFNLEDGSLQGTFGTHAGEINGLLFSANGQVILTAGADGMVRSFPGQPPATRQIETGHAADVTAFDFSPNSALLATASADKTVKLWNYTDGKPKAELTGHGGKIAAVSFSSNSTQVATGGEDKIARLFETGAGKLVREFPAQPGPISAVAISPNTQELAVGDSTGAVQIYKSADGTALHKLEGHGGAVRNVQYTPNGQQILAVGAGKEVLVWNAADGKELRRLAVESPVVSFQIHPSGAQVAVACEDRQIRLLNVADGKLLATLSGHDAAITSLAFSRDQQKLVATADDGSAIVWDLRQNEPVQRFSLHTGRIAGAGFASDSRTLVSAGSDRLVQFDQVSVQMAHRADAVSVNAIAFNSNGSQHVTGGSDGAVKLWNTSNGTPAREYAGLTAAVRAVSISPNNQQISAADEKSLHLWNMNNTQPQFRIETTSPVTQLEYSFDGSRLLTAAADHVLRNYDPAPLNPQPPVLPSREPAQQTDAHPAAVQALAFTPGHRIVWSAAADGSLRKWTIAASSFTATLQGHASQVYALSFSPDGSQLVSASADK